MAFADASLLGITLAHWLVVASALIGATGAAAYIRDTLAGRSQPNRVTWGLWAAAPLIATGAAIAAQADGWATFRIFMSGFMPLLIFCASFMNRRSFWKASRFDIACAALSIGALIAWALARSPVLAILLAAVADGFAGLPTLLKAWRHPETETPGFYVLSFLAALIVLPAIPAWTIENSAFQVYLLAMNSLLVLAIYRKRILAARRPA